MVYLYTMLNTKFTLISYPPILKISFGLSMHGLSYSLKRNWRSNSKFTHQLIMDSPDLIPVLLHYDSNINGLWKFLFSLRSSPVWYLQFPKMCKVFWIKSLRLKQIFYQYCLWWEQHSTFCKIWTWPSSAFKAVTEAILVWSQWKFLEMWVRY